MTIGNWFLFDRWVEQNAVDAGGNLIADDIYAILCGSAQALDRDFVGASGDCRYADLTAQFSTANGYTAGGIILPNKTITLVSGWMTLTSDSWEWTITSELAGIKYCVLYAPESGNDDLIAACNLDTDGSTITAAVGPFTFDPDPAGILRWRQP